MRFEINSEDDKFYTFEKRVLELLDFSKFHSGQVGEVKLFGSTWTLPNERSYEILSEVDLYVSTLVRRVDFIEAFPHFKSVTVESAKRTKSTRVTTALGERSSLGVGKIVIPEHEDNYRSPFMREWYILHELTHVLSKKDDHHGKLFRREFYSLISLVWGVEFSRLLEIIFEDSSRTHDDKL